MQQVDPPSDSQEQSPFQALLTALDADALLAARGDIGPMGDVTIRRPFLHAIKVTEDFVKGYERLAPHDVVGILFAEDARIVERVSASQYDRLKGAGNSKAAQAWNKKIRDYLRDAGFEHLILAGLRSKRLGLAWVVAYRKRLKPAFSESDADIARYHVPYLLFEALREKTKPSAEASTSGNAAGGGLLSFHAEKKPSAAASTSGEAAGGNLIPIDADRLRVAILEARGFGPSAIADRLDKSPSAISNSLTYVRELLQIPEEQQRITMRNLEHYTGEVSDEQAKVDHVSLKNFTEVRGRRLTRDS